MSTTTKHIFRVVRYKVYFCIGMSFFSLAHAETWYDSEGKALTVNGREVRLKTEKEKRKTLPVLKDKIPSIVKEKAALSKNLTVTPKNSSRSNRFNRLRNNQFGFISYPLYRRINFFTPQRRRGQRFYSKFYGRYFNRY